MSLTPETAWLEAQQAFPFKAQPLTLCAYEVHCAKMLDLSQSDVRTSVNVTLNDITCAWEAFASQGEEPPSWRLADRLIALGAAAIIAPSFASHASDQDKNLIFWRWQRQKPYLLRVIDDHHRLSRNDRSSR